MTPETTYQRVLLQMRQEYIREGGMLDNVRASYHRLFATMLLDLGRDLDRGIITPERAEGLRREIERVLREFVQRLLVALAGREGGFMAQAALMVAAAHQSAFAQANAIAGTSLRPQFTGIPDRAVSLMLARSREGGLSTSFKSLIEYHYRQVAAELDTFLMSAVGRGVPWNRATLEFAAILARQDPDLQKALKGLGPRGGKLAKKIADLGEVDAEGLKAARELLFRARRIVIHETNQAHQAASLVASAESPVVALVKWTLSGRHAGLPSSPDVCDVVAAADVGYGPGLYRPEVAPSLLHPFCLCTAQPVTRPVSEWGDPKPAIRKPEGIPLGLTERIMKGAVRPQSGTLTPKRMQRAMDAANQYIGAAYGTWTQVSTL